MRDAWAAKKDSKTFIPKILTAQLKNADTLYSYGARKILFVTSPRLSRSPIFVKDPRAYELMEFYRDYSKALQEGVKKWAPGKEGAKVEVFDYFDFFVGLWDKAEDKLCTSEKGDKCLWWGPSPFHVSKYVHQAMAKELVKGQGVMEKLGW